mmetsp:Transcript_7254/g.20458  ORF Transcript_7254/g.20458 Transcript_7254/m.20458 type:complete len:131 (-) Transcript_7254:5-397(-)
MTGTGAKSFGPDMPVLVVEAAVGRRAGDAGWRGVLLWLLFGRRAALPARLAAVLPALAEAGRLELASAARDGAAERSAQMDLAPPRRARTIRSLLSSRLMVCCFPQRPPMAKTRGAGEWAASTSRRRLCS